MKVIKSFEESGCTTSEYTKYLLGQSAWAVVQLASPEITFANGKSSHALARDVASQASGAYTTLTINRGRFYANGKLAHFA